MCIRDSAGEASRGHIPLLPFERDVPSGFRRNLEQQRTRPAGRVVGGRGRFGVRPRNPDHFRHDAADFGRGVELSLALAALRGEVPHQVFVGIPQDVIVLGAVLREIQFRLLEDGDEVGQTLDLRRTIPKFCLLYTSRCV